RRASEKLTIDGIPLGDDEVPRVVVTRKHYDAVAHKLSGLGDFQPELVYEDLPIIETDPRDAAEVAAVNGRAEACLLTVKDGLDLPVIAAFRLLAAKIDARHPILLKDSLDPHPDPQTPFVRTLLAASTRLGSLLCDGIGDAILLRTEDAPGQTLRLSYNILQAVGARIFKTDYVACPSCGRTLFNLQETTARIKAATEHLKGVKIAIMGCIVNGPGEMADADFGYVGGAPGKVNLYVGKKAVKFNIPETEAVDRLVDLIKEHGRWVEAPEAKAAALA
ncbi:MAG: flavodoxin-dependent (E)-4-hydroxy-3-methylbut-2-enyl-diphosphate synthase, partial [Chthoniobacterales bacterium]